MVKIKKLLALISVVFVIMSNLAFAQSDASSYEGRPIDPEKEGKEYYREGNVIVYPAQMNSEEKMIMERFNRGELSEEEMKKMAKEKFGSSFDEMEFKKSMMEFKERAERKESFSYEHEGYQGYYHSPSYEGYSKEHMIYGMLFEHIGDDIDPRDIKQNCNEPDKIADIVIGKLKEKIGDFQSVCKRMDEQESKCEEHSRKGCSQVGSAYVRDDATELEKLNAIAYSCPPNKDAIVEACKKRNRLHMEQRLENLDEECKKRFDYEGERLVRECERFRENQVCDKEKYIERCMGGIKKESFERKCDRELCKAFICCDSSKGVCPLGFPQQCSECTKDICETVAQSCTKEECGLAPGMPNYLCSDGKTTAGPRCQHDASGRCGWQITECPQTQCAFDTKQCLDGSYVARDPAKNCEFKPCPTTAACPEPTKPACAENHILKSKTDSNGCVYYFCETAATACPEPITPACSSGQTLQKKTDDMGCVSYYCANVECPQVSKPACNADERLETYYDNRGCVTSYQCVKTTITTCPSVSKPTCAEGQHMTTKYDDKSCVASYECVSVTSSTTSSATGAVVLSTYDDFLRHCENSWNEQQRICLNTPKACDKEDFIEKCRDQERKHSSDLNTEIERNCQSSTESEVRHAEERCSRIDDERKKCMEQGAKRCGQMKGNAEKCRELMTEERVRKFIVEEVTKRCKFKDILADEEDVKSSDKAEIVLAVLNTAAEEDIEKLRLFIDGLEKDLKLQDTTIYKGIINPSSFGDIKLLPFVVNAKISATKSSERAKEVKARIVASSRVEEAASKLASLRDSDVPAEYLYIIEDKASEVLDASDELEDVEKKEEEKGIGYKIKLFLGLAKAAEQEEIKQLEESNSKLQNSIETLTKLIEEVPSDVAKSILKEQVENLKEQQADTKILIESKEKKAKGLFGVFG